ncbi:MAG TPA: hypothetical protein DGT21_08715 [Armatimonadetes bacterium]|nr:hypothetical protein [Armatimonadota bacterium]
MLDIRTLVPLAGLLIIAACSSAADLPISRVVLFSSGVGYFERAGTVQGNTTVELSFRVDQINDMLKSMTLQDMGGGTIGAITYAPQDPLSHTLRSFSVDVIGNQSLADLLRSLIGAKVSVVTADATVKGTVMGVEQQEKSVGDNVVTFDVVNLLSEKGIVQVPIWHMKSVTLAEEKLSGDLTKALAAIAGSRDLDKRTVKIELNGAGAREVAIGYLLETPVWKTSYRLMTQKDGLFIQGWAIVENTTDADWERVRLGLVSGQPISFIENLYEPLYVQRPVIQPQIAAIARPRIYEGAVEREEAYAADMAPSAPPMAMAAPAPAEKRRSAMAGAAGPAGVYGQIGDDVSGAIDLSVRGVESAAEGGKVGELFQYAISAPVTIARQQSAMIPIINQAVEGRKISIYNASQNARHPYNGIKVKNSTALHLMGGPITVFDGGVYAGDALIDDVPPGDERMIAYAVDLGVRVDSTSADKSDALAVSLKIVKGLLTTTSKQVSEKTYTIKNVAADDRLVVVEHPLRAGWKLIEPAKADERTDALYRFHVPVAAGKSATLKTLEERPVSQTVWLKDTDTDDLGMFMRVREISEQMKAALTKLRDMRGAINAIDKQIEEREERLEEIGEEQERIRQNMEQLDHDSELYKTYVSKFAEQEKEFETLRGEIKKLKADRAVKEKELTDYVESLNVE